MALFSTKSFVSPLTSPTKLTGRLLFVSLLIHMFHILHGYTLAPFSFCDNARPPIQQTHNLNNVMFKGILCPAKSIYFTPPIL